MASRAAATPTERSRGYAQMALALAGAWAIVPPYLGPAVGLDLDVSAKVEVVDHVVPGVIIILAGALAAMLARRGPQAEYGAPALGLTACCFLAGLWQLATHFPLVLDAGGPQTPWDSVLLHTTPAPVIVALALWLTFRTPGAELEQAAAR